MSSRIYLRDLLLVSSSHDQGLHILKQLLVVASDPRSRTRDADKEQLLKL